MKNLIPILASTAIIFFINESFAIANESGKERVPECVEINSCISGFDKFEAVQEGSDTMNIVIAKTIMTYKVTKYCIFENGEKKTFNNNKKVEVKGEYSYDYDHKDDGFRYETHRTRQEASSLALKSLKLTIQDIMKKFPLCLDKTK